MLEMPPGVAHERGCDGDPLGWWVGSTTGEFADRQPVLIFGVVPDDVSRVTYDGRDVPVANNVFVLTDPAPIADPSSYLPLSYFVGDCRIPMYVQGQTFAPGVARSVFRPSPTCSP